MLDGIRRTSENTLAGGVRLLLGVLFLLTGAMKLVVPRLGEAFSGQLEAANIPFHALSRWSVPFVELAVGAVLVVGVYARPAIVVVIGIMAVATFVHFVVDDPSLFPLQPTEPIIPLLVMLGCAFLLWKGAGAWSLDLKATRAVASDARLD